MLDGGKQGRKAPSATSGLMLGLSTPCCPPPFPCCPTCTSCLAPAGKLSRRYTAGKLSRRYTLPFDPPPPLQFIGPVNASLDDTNIQDGSNWSDPQSPLCCNDTRGVRRILCACLDTLCPCSCTACTAVAADQPAVAVLGTSPWMRRSPACQPAALVHTTLPPARLPACPACSTACTAPPPTETLCW